MPHDDVDDLHKAPASSAGPSPPRRMRSLLALVLVLVVIVASVVVFDMELTGQVLARLPRHVGLGCPLDDGALETKATKSTKATAQQQQQQQNHRSYLVEGNASAWLTGLARKTTAEDRNGTKHCSPTLLDPREIEYPHAHPFYKHLRALPALPPPVFYGEQTVLCDADNANDHRWGFCLPIHGRKDTPYCLNPDRMDLLTGPHTRDSMCFASALHMLLVDVYEEIAAMDHKPLLLYGTLLGAVREGATIPFTEDSDIGYRNMTQVELETLRATLRRRGYHMYFDGLWRVCVAPNHPLATVLFDDTHVGVNRYTDTPYVDLYEMRRHNGTHWYVDCTHADYLFPNDKFEPHAQVRMNGMLFDTVADPVDFLIREYGPGYMTPKPRGGG